MKDFKPMGWICQHFDCNAQVIKNYDVLKYRERAIKQMKKKSNTKEEFASLLKREMMYYYWSKCEWELIMHPTDDGRIILSPWVGCREPEKVSVDVTDREDFDWKGFARYHCNRLVKIDIYDQLEYRWNEFVDYCWNYRHKWQRRKKDEI